MGGLPRFVVFQSAKYTKRYLRYVNEDVQLHGFLQFTGVEVVNPYAKFEVELSKTGQHGLVHIRCCYNNKYWVRWSENHHWIVAGADKPEEDQSKWSCTLFEPIFDDAKTIRLRHVQLHQYASLSLVDAFHDSCLFVGSTMPDKDLNDLFNIFDWESLLILPKHVAFKCDNHKYLAVRETDDRYYLEAASDDIGDPTVGNEVITNPNGTICLKSMYLKKLWRRSPNWIWPDAFDFDDLPIIPRPDPSTKSPDTLFWPVKVSENVVALRNLGNNNFCARLTADGKTSCLNASVPTITKEARLEVEELVISRKIYNVNFHLMDARIYNQTVITMTTGQATNRSHEPNGIDVKLSYTETKTSTWNASVSLKLNVTTTIQTGIPIIADGKIKVSADFSSEYKWGETNTSTKQVETTYKVTVPPMTSVKVSLLATKGTCDVPFSYSQRDTLTNGEQTTYTMDDGVYSGVNCYNFKYETEETPL